MNEIMYLKEVDSTIICTNYFGENLDKVKKFIIKSFKSNQKIVSMAINDRKTYIMLNSNVVLVFKDINMLKNEIFKDLISEFKLAFIKYHIKRFANNTNFHLHRIFDKKIVISASALTMILLTSSIAFANSVDDFVESKLVVQDNNSYESLNEIVLQLDIDESSYEDIDTKEIEPFSEIEDLFTIESTENYSEKIDNDNIEEDLLIFKDMVTTEQQIANSPDFYVGDVYNNLIEVMNDYGKTAELNNKIGEYISKNLKGKMWGNATGQGYDNYKIPEKYKNGEFTLDELFTDASLEFGVPKDILVSVSQHECGQGYYPVYTEPNCGGMMGYLNVHNIHSSNLPGGGYDGCDITTNPAVSIYAYASTVRFFYDSFKNIDVGYGFDSWDISLAMIAIGQGDVSNNDVGFKYRADYEELGWSQLNICAPQFKALREAYLNGILGVNDLTLTAENGAITHWTDGEKFYYIDGEFTFDKMKTSDKVLVKK